MDESSAAHFVTVKVDVEELIRLLREEAGVATRCPASNRVSWHFLTSPARRGYGKGGVSSFKCTSVPSKEEARCGWRTYKSKCHCTTKAFGTESINAGIWF